MCGISGCLRSWREHPSVNDRLRAVELGDRRGRDDLLAARFAVTHVKGHPLRHVRRARVDRSGGPHGVDILERHPRDLVLFRLLVLFLFVPVRKIGGALHVIDGERAVRHSERPEDPLANEIFPRRPLDLAGEIPGRHEHEILILELAPKTHVRLEIAKPVEELLAREGRPVPEEIVAGEPRAVADEIARRHLAARVVVVKRERRKIRPHRFVPFDETFLDEHAEYERGERLAR